MKRALLIVLPGVVAVIGLIVFIVVTRPSGAGWGGDSVQGRLEVGTGFGGMNSEGVVELTVHKWLVTDDAVYTLRFLPDCKLIRIENDPAGEQVFVGQRWIGLRPGAVYKAKGVITEGGLISSRHGERQAKTMDVTHFEYVK